MTVGIFGTRWLFFVRIRATNLDPVKRLAALVLVLMSLAVPAHALAAAPPVAAQQAQEEPAIVIEDSGAVSEDDAWTFRFLVPILMAITVVLVIGLIVWYQRGFAGRYRVRE